MDWKTDVFYEQLIIENVQEARDKQGFGETEFIN